MTFKIGNQLWKLRAKHGRDAIFDSPELLWKTACEYFEICDNDDTWNSVKSTSNDKGISDEIKPIKRPYTRGGLFLYIGCSEDWLRNFKKICNDDFLRVIYDIERTIDTQQIEGAMTGNFNSNLVARIQGIVEHQKIEQTIEDNRTLTETQIDKLIDKL
jgi:hypothetical protein